MMEYMSNSLSTANLLTYLKTLEFKSSPINRLKVYYRPVVSPIVDLIHLVKEGEKVGDIGCGSGQFCLLLTKFAKPSYIYGIEISDKLVSNAKQLFERYSTIPFAFEKFDGIQFPEKIKELDVIILMDVLHHVPKANQRQFIVHLIGAMKSGARLILKDIDGGSPLVYFNKLHDLIFAGEKGNELTYQTTQAWLQENGLEILEFNKRRMYVYPHYTIVAKKK